MKETIRKKARVFLPLCLLFFLLCCFAGCSDCTGEGKDPTLLPKTAGEVSSADCDLFFTDFHQDTQEAGAKEILLSEGGNTLPKGVEQQGNQIRITQEGSYIVKGTLSDGVVLVNAPDQFVHLILDNLTLTCQNGAPLYVQAAKAVVITVKEGTVNTLSDALSYTYIDGQRLEPDAAICSRADLTFNGKGTLIVHAKGADGIKGKDALRLTDLKLEIHSEKEGICGKDALILRNVRGKVEAKQDGLKSTHDLDPERGFVLLSRCELTVVSGQDGIQAMTALVLGENNLDITAGGGYETALALDAKSCKGMKAETRLAVESGTYALNTADDGLHAKHLTVCGGTVTLKAGTDGLQGDGSVTVSGGKVEITHAEDGVKGGGIQLLGGALRIVCEDDGITARKDTADPSVIPSVTVAGGRLQISAKGDGMKSEGDLAVTGGVSLIFSDIGCSNPPVHASGAVSITGGTVLLSGNSALTQTLPSGIPQVLFRCSPALEANGVGAVVGAEGEQQFTFDVGNKALTVLFLSADLTAGRSYRLLTASSCTGGESENGVYGKDVTLVQGVEVGNAIAVTAAMAG